MCFPLRNSPLPDSRSLAMFAERLGLTGTGAGGVGDSRESRLRCSWLRVSSSSVRARELDWEVMALVVGFRVIGRSVKVSVSSMVNAEM